MVRVQLKSPGQRRFLRKCLEEVDKSQYLLFCSFTEYNFKPPLDTKALSVSHRSNIYNINLFQCHISDLQIQMLVPISAKVILIEELFHPEGFVLLFFDLQRNLCFSIIQDGALMGLDGHLSLHTLCSLADGAGPGWQAESIKKFSAMLNL